MDIPKDLTFYNTMDPYSDEAGSPVLEGRPSSPSHTPHLSAQQRQWIAQQASRRPLELNSHGLEALSAAALGSPVQGDMIGHSNPLFLQANPPGSNIDSSSPHLMSFPPTVSSNNDINYILNAPSSSDSPIDPTLVSENVYSTVEQVHDSTPDRNRPLVQSRQGKRGDVKDRYESDHKVAYLLRHFSESPGQWLAKQQASSSESS